MDSEISTLETRAFLGANTILSTEEYQQLVRDLWAAACDGAELTEEAISKPRSTEPASDTPILDRMLSFRSCALWMAADNGVINKGNPTGFLKLTEDLLGHYRDEYGVTSEDFEVIESVITLMSDEERETLIAGEHTETLLLIDKINMEHSHVQVRVSGIGIGVGTVINNLLNDIFESC